MNAHFDSKEGFVDPVEDNKIQVQERLKSIAIAATDTITSFNVTLIDFICIAKLVLKGSLDFAAKEGIEVDMKELERLWDNGDNENED